jgi:hypothetical protein
LSACKSIKAMTAAVTVIAAAAAAGVVEMSPI